MPRTVTDTQAVTGEGTIENSGAILGIKDWGAVIAILFAITLVTTFLLSGVGYMEITPEMAPVATAMFGFIVGRAATLPL